MKRRGRPPESAKRIVLAGAVVLDLVAADELFTDGDLDVITHDTNLDLATPIGVTGPIVRPGEAHVAGGINLA